MKNVWSMFFMIFILLILSACTDQEQVAEAIQGEAQEEAQEETKQEEELVAELDKEKAHDILKENLNSIYRVFIELGQKNRWHNSMNPADFNEIKPNLKNYASQQFIDTEMNALSSEFYCDCGQIFFPDIHPTVRFQFHQHDHVLEITGLEPATEFKNMGTIWKFEFIHQDNIWKINHWESERFDGKALQLTKEEAKELLVHAYDKTPVFVSEYYSDEGGDTAYLFELGVGQAAISSKDSSFVYDYPDAQQSEESKTVVRNTDLPYYLDETFYIGYTREDLIREFGEPVKTREELANLMMYYDHAVYTISSKTNQVHIVSILENKASSFYRDFNEVYQAFSEAGWTFEEDVSDGEYYLVCNKDDYSIVFTADSPEGIIESIRVQYVGNESQQSEEIDGNFEYTSYTNEGFGYTVEYPTTFTASELSPQGGTIDFSNGEATIIVSGTYREEGETNESLYNQSIQSIDEPIAYERLADDWYVVSYVKGDEVIYTKNIMGEEIRYVLLITYPVHKKEIYDPMVERVAGSFDGWY